MRPLLPMLRQRTYAALLLVLAVVGCSLPAGVADRRFPSSSPSPSRVADLAALRACHAQLAQAGASFTALPDRSEAPGCELVGTVQLSELASDSARLRLRNLGPVTCETGRVFADWARFGADRAARAILRSPLVAIETMGSYACRNVAGTARRSAHATGNAIDVSAFVLSDGRRISVATGWLGADEAERRFLRVVHQSACRRFATVLGPGYNAAHRDHLHLEGVRGAGSFCR